MLVVPEFKPVTLPLASTVPTEGDELLHVPPLIPLLSTVLVPGQMLADPVRAGADDDTVNTSLALQPELVVKVMPVVPADRPLTTPAALTVPTAVLLLLQLPVVPPLNAEVPPAHTLSEPLITGVVFTFTVAVREQPFDVV
jgi:hypothetical protein